MTPDTPEGYTLSNLTQPSGPAPGARKRRRNLIIGGIAASVIALVLGGGGAAVLVAINHHTAAPAPGISPTRSATPSGSPLDPSSRAACEALQAAGVDGQSDPTRMRVLVVKAGGGGLDPTIKADAAALLTAAESGAPDDPQVQLAVAGAASTMMADCYQGGYIKP